MNSQSRLFSFRLLAAVRFALFRLNDVIKGIKQRTDIRIHNYFQVMNDTQTGVCVEGIVLQRAGYTGMLFSAVVVPLLAGNRTKEKSR